jgi:choline dehydrogenase
MHGSGGEWRVEKQRLRWDVLDAFARAAQQAGIPATDDFNRGNNEGVGYFEVNQKAGWRWNTTKAFLRPTCLRRATSPCITGCPGKPTAFRCTAPLHRRRCCGMASSTIEVRANAEVILCAGAIGSPQLLELSGIGAGERLRELGIPLIQELPGVGENLQDHLQIRSVFSVSNTRTLNTRANSLWGKAIDRPGICAQAQRPDEHGAQPVGGLYPQRPGAALAEPRNTTCNL